MTSEQIIRKIQSDAIYALNFVVDNNPDGTLSALASYGYSAPSGTNPTEFAKNTLIMLLKSDKNKCIEIVSSIPYNKSKTAADYTQGFYDYFKRSTPASMVTAGKFSLDALFAGLGSGLSTYSGVSLYNGANGLPTGTQAQQAAQIQYEAEQKKKKTNLIIGLSVVGLITLGVIIYFVTKKKKDN